MLLYISWQSIPECKYKIPKNKGLNLSVVKNVYISIRLFHLRRLENVEKTYKIICCHCGYMHKKSDLNELLEKCHDWNEVLSDGDGWVSHSVRIFVGDADPAIIKHFIKEVKKKQTRINSKKKSTQRKRSHSTAKKVA